MRAITLYATILVGLASAPAADITAQDVLARLEERRAEGARLSWDKTTEDDNGLLLTDVRASIERPRFDIVFEIGDVRLVTQDGDEIPLTFPAAVLFRVESRFPGDRIIATGTMRSDTAQIVFSGDPDALTQSVSFESLTLTLDSVDGQTDLADPDFELALTGVEADLLLNAQEAGIARSDYDVSVASLSMTASGVPEGGARQSLSATAGPISVQSNTSLPVQASGPSILAEEGFGLTAAAEVSNGSLMVDLGPQEAGIESFSATLASGKAILSLNDGRALAVTDTETLRVQAAAPDLAFPLDIQIAGSRIMTEGPFVVTEAFQSFPTSVSILGIEPSPTAWAAADPLGTIPRFPGTITLESELKGRWVRDPTDPMNAGREDALEVQSFTLEDLSVDGSGVSLTGTGSLEYAGDPPDAQGTFNFDLTGAFGLLNALAQLGILEPVQVFGAQFALSFITVPGDGEDSLTSEIQIGPNGALSANGQRLR